MLELEVGGLAEGVAAVVEDAEGDVAATAILERYLAALELPESQLDQPWASLSGAAWRT